MLLALLDQREQPPKSTDGIWLGLDPDPTTEQQSITAAAD
jgi:hypothetical protein